MTDSSRRGDAAIRAVLSFLFAHWLRRRWTLAFITVAITVATLAEVLVPLFAGRLIDTLALGDAGRGAALVAFATMAALGLTMVALRQLGWSAIPRFTLGMMQDAALDAFGRVQRFSTDWHANNFAGSVQRKITRGMWALDILNDVLLLMMLPSLVALVGAMALLTFHSPAVGLVMAAGALAYGAVTVALATRFVAPASSLSNQWDTRVGGLLADAIGANAVVKAFGAESREEARLGHMLAKWRRRTRRAWHRAIGSGSAQLLLLWTVQAGVTGSALWLWWHGSASAGDVVYVLTTYFVVHGYLRDIGQYAHELQQAVNEAEEMVELDRQPPGVADRPDARPIRITGDIRFEHVDFHYAAHTRPLFADLDVAIPAGQRVGLVGRSGSGKTSFVKLIQRLYDVSGGSVLIDSQDIAHATQESLRRQIAIVAQEPILFHRSLADNIAYARPEATQAEIEHAAMLANAHGFIARLPKGYRTLVGERGVKLSGGERQRVAIARAFLADAPILILDEATSSLDSESEAAIQQAMERWNRDGSCGTMAMARRRDAWVTVETSSPSIRIRPASRS